MDAVAELILAEAGSLPARVAVLNDRDGAITLAVAARRVRVAGWCDDVRDAASLPSEYRLDTLQQALADADLVLLRLPRSLTALDEYAQVAAHFAPDARLIAGGRVKDLTPRMNDVLARSFGSVSASLGVRKSRVLRAGDPTPSGPLRWPQLRRIDELGMDVVAHGETFNTNRLDAGTRALLSTFDKLPAPGKALDLGSGSGLLAVALARRGFRVDAADSSWAAVDSTRQTAAANGVEVTTHWADGLTPIQDADCDLIVCNPPFHRGVAKDSGVARDFFADAPRVLRPGAEFRTVFNSHLPYLGWLRELIGPTRVIARDRHYTVTSSVRRG